MSALKQLSYPLVTVGLVLLAGCAKTPDLELISAKHALEDARQAGAVDYATEQFKKAEDAMQKAQEEIKAQEERLAVARDYDKAKEFLAKAKADAEVAKASANTAKEKAKGEAQAALKEAQGSVGVAKELLARAPAGKSAQAGLEAMRRDLKTAESILPEIQSALDKQDYISAKAKAQAVKEKATAVSAQVQARDKMARGKKVGHASVGPSGPRVEFA